MLTFVMRTKSSMTSNERRGNMVVNLNKMFIRPIGHASEFYSRLIL